MNAKGASIRTGKGRGDPGLGLGEERVPCAGLLCSRERAALVSGLVAS